METTSLNTHSSISFDAPSRGVHMDSEKVSVHWQVPPRTVALLSFAAVFPVSTETRDKTSLSHPLGIYKTDKCITETFSSWHKMSVRFKILANSINGKLQWKGNINQHYMPVSYYVTQEDHAQFCFWLLNITLEELSWLMSSNN